VAVPCGRLRRWIVIAPTLAALAFAALSVPGQAAATDEPPTVSPAAPNTTAAPQMSLSGVTGPQVVTLVTGDRVRLTPVAGRYSAEPEADTSTGGRQPRFVTQADPGGVYVYPDDALAVIQAGLVDRELFNVKYLAENGYADTVMQHLPVIAQYPATQGAASVARAAEALPGSTATTTLESIHASALDVPKSAAASFWAAVRSKPDRTRSLAAPAALGAGVAKLWLDRKMTASLDQSVPLIGAPEAWAGGHDGSGVKVAVLDTGIDSAHPDLAGKVVDSKSFVPAVDTVGDGVGHGTHIASTITGSGAASGGRYKGVAPGVKLVVGKVLDDGGSGEMSWIIEGMEWAAASGAKVVSMSLGACCSDGTDPASQAVNALTARTGALFVVAAGNNGGDETINSPGAADAALTVAATDKTDHHAAFSSRGPRPGDSAAKPDIAAPGVSIVAGRAAGTSMPGATHVGEHYTTVSGTSMATPHVAGAAAILAQAHPDWTPGRIKSVLTSTSKDNGYSIYQQGAGRLDVARAYRQQVFANEAAIDYRNVSSDISDPVARQVGYTNLGEAPVTLTLSSSLRTVGGTTVEGRVSTDQTVTVPAGGTAPATVTVDVTDLPFGRYTGSVVAIDEATGVRVTTPIGLVREAPTYALTVRTLGRDGKPGNPYFEAVIDVAGEQGEIGGHVVTEPGTVVTRVHAGTYSVTQLMDWVGEDSTVNRAWLFDPEVTVTGDTEITLDARKAGQVKVRTSRPSEEVAQSQYSGFQRTTAGGARFELSTPHSGTSPLWATPTDKVRTGGFGFFLTRRLARPELSMAVTGPRGPALHPVHQPHVADGLSEDGHGYVHFSGSRKLPLVDVGLGTPDELAGRNLDGKLVLAHAGLEPGVFGPVCGMDVDRIEAIRVAGAAGIVVFPSPDSHCFVPVPTTQEPFTGPLRPVKIPKVSISTTEGVALRARLSAGPVSIQVTSLPESPYSYAISPYEADRVPDSLNYDLADHELARVDLVYQNSFKAGDGAADSLYSTTAGQRIANTVAITAAHTGRARTEFIGPLSSDVLYTRIVSAGRIVPPGQHTAVQGPADFGQLERFDRKVRLRQRWLVTPTTPGAGPQSLDLSAILDGAPPGQRMAEACVVCRQGDVLFPMFFMTSVNGGLGRHDGMNRKLALEDFHDFSLRLTSNGTEIPRTTLPLGLPKFDLPAGPATYRLTADGPTTDTTWTFTSARPAADEFRTGYLCIPGGLTGKVDPCRPEPVLFVGYDLGDSLDLDGAVTAGRSHEFGVEVTQPQTVTPPKVAGLRLWSSIDDGRHWTPVPVRRDKDGGYTARAFYPPIHHTTGAVSLKVEAWDPAGNRVEQISTRAFALRKPGR